MKIDDTALRPALAIPRPDEHPGILAFGDRVLGQFADIAFFHQRLQRRRVDAVVGVEVVDRLSHHLQVVLERRFARAVHRTGDCRRREAGEQGHDQQDEQELDQRESLLRLTSC